MARQLSGYTYDSLSVPEAYFNIANLQISFVNKTAQIDGHVFTSAAARQAGEAPLDAPSFSFGPDIFDAAFGGAPAAGENGSVPSAECDAIRATAYQALLTVHPDAMQLLANSTAV